MGFIWPSVTLLRGIVVNSTCAWGWGLNSIEGRCGLRRGLKFGARKIDMESVIEEEGSFYSVCNVPGEVIANTNPYFPLLSVLPQNFPYLQVYFKLNFNLKFSSKEMLESLCEFFQAVWRIKIFRGIRKRSINLSHKEMQEKQYFVFQLM